MAAPTDPLELVDFASDFPAASEDDWRALVAGVLRRSGRPDTADPVEALTANTYDDIAIRPLYPAGPDPALDRVARDGAWDVRTRHRDPDAAAANAAILNDLETGATSLWLTIGTGGLAVDDLPSALRGVYLGLAPVVLDAGDRSAAAARALLDLAGDVEPGSLQGSLGADPIGWRARTGADCFRLAELVALAGGYRRLRIATVDGTVYHDAGAGDATEIAAATATGVAYLRELTDAGLAVDEAFDRIEFRIAVTADQFGSIAKLRAARQVWQRVAELCGADNREQHQHAVTSAVMLTRRDPWVNLLRTTIGCFAAAVGGADAITVLPFDTALGLPDDFARRIARNTHAVLHDESSLGRVADAAGGSWYVESFTARLAEQAWQRFTDIEQSGGALAALDGGLLGGLVASTRRRRADDIAHRRAPLTGVTEFALPDEPALERLAAPQAPSGGPLEAVRWAAEFEELRDRVEARETRPAVFLATLGPQSQHSARLAFARNLFNAGGFRVLDGAADEFASSGAAVACVCSSDTVYADEAEHAIAALRAAGAKQVWIAGRHDGADGQLYAGCDALAVLRTTEETTA
ncbi:MAG TPA: methylmalonyl-CoA mutase subunit beta [Jatrophihabitans sp.]|jgi:methylmalonyl-CoA mutase